LLLYGTKRYAFQAPLSFVRHSHTHHIQHHSHRHKPSHSNEQNHVTKLKFERLISEYAAKPQEPINLENLLKFGPYPIPDDVLLENAASVLKTIAVRLAHRLETLRNLPYLIVLNPNISQIYSIYYNSFTIISQTTPPTTREENKKIVEILKRLVHTHSDTIPVLARGFYEAAQYISSTESSKIIDSHLRARIGTRLLAEHHIALTDPIDPEKYIGAVEKACRPGVILKHAAEFVGDICDLRFGIVPTIKIEQGDDIQLPYVPVHIEYIFTELLKNSFRASIEHSIKTNTPLEPVWATIVRTSTGVIIRIRDRGGGIAPELEKYVFGYSFTTFNNDSTENGQDSAGFSTLNTPPGAGNTLAGMGYGLPLSRAYAEFFGGKLQVQTYYGWGTDVYVTLKSPPQ
jgi:hypothetical protein